MKIQISVIGQGYVGLPIAMAACEAGYQVVGIDTDHKKIDQLQSGISGLEDVSNQLVSKYLKSGSYQPTTEFEGQVNFSSQMLYDDAELSDLILTRHNHRRSKNYPFNN